MSNEIMRREIREAIVAGERALNSLNEAKQQLNSAKNWGLFDIFADFMTQSKISDASYQVDEAISKVQNILRDLKNMERTYLISE